jgi:phospholipase C
MGSRLLLTRRRVLRAGAGVAAAATAARYSAILNRAAAAGMGVPDTLPDPSRPAGEPTAAMPFDHIVVVMMENHSFDNYLGMLAKRGQPAADGFRFDAAGKPIDSNPYKDGYVTVKRAASLCQPGGVGQSWRSTHLQMDNGRMDGFAKTGLATMQYWDQDDLPFYYSLAKTFALGDRWFGSAPCQTYPNRRFMLAGTAFGLISTDNASILEDPPNGTIVDRLVAHGVSWRNYFSDVPATGVIESIPQNHPQNLASVAQFYTDCAIGNLPAVSWVDPDIGVASVVSDATFGNVPAPFGPPLRDQVGAQNQSEENPADISLGENFVSGVVNAVLSSPLWPRILLLWVYDEHGGYYDHVPPPAAIPPDDIPPRLGPDDPKGGYDIYGPRVPAVVVSGHARKKFVTSVVHDHTSILATIQHKWNLPTMTHRDANATTMMDFLDPGAPTFPEPPTLAAPSDLLASEQNCSFAQPQFVVHPGEPPVQASDDDQLLVRFRGRRHGGAAVTMHTRRGTIRGLVVKLTRGGHVVATAHVAHLGRAVHRVTLKPRPGHRLAAGGYTLVVRRGKRTLLRRHVHLGR